jgi:hypothetical protein
VGRERGQATIEWTGLVLVVALALGGIGAAGPRVDGRPLGALLAHKLACAVRGGCDDGDDELVAAYGERGAELVRELAPSIVYERGTHALPVDYRDCRERRCSDAPDDPDLDVHRSARTGDRATAFTHLLHRGGETYIQYWLYYPDSNSTVLGASAAWGATLGRAGLGYPGFHPDDWEGYEVRIDRAGRAYVRSTSHGHYQACKQRRCRNRWTARTGWTRVSRGSHAGHIPLRSRRVEMRIAPRWPPVRSRYRYEPLYPGRDLRERTTTAPALRLVPLETIDRSSYEPLPGGIRPPWTKEAYSDPLSDSS